MPSTPLDYLPHHRAVAAVDDLAPPSESNDYAAYTDYLASDGTLLFRIAADAVHNHGGFYTRRYPVDDPSGKRLKRLNIAGGSEDTEVRLLAGRGGSSRLWVDSEANSTLTLTSNGNRVDIYLTADGHLRFDDHANRQKLLDIDLNAGGSFSDPRVDALEADIAVLESRLADVTERLEAAASELTESTQ